MTAAVCIRCGRMKVGAFTTCPGCRFTPQDLEDQAKSILLSDQSTDKSALAKASARLKAGGEIAFDPQAVAQWAAAIRTNPPIPRMPLGCAIVWYAPLAILALLVIVLVAVLIYLKWSGA